MTDLCALAVVTKSSELQLMAVFEAGRECGSDNITTVYAREMRCQTVSLQRGSQALASPGKPWPTLAHSTHCTWASTDSGGCVVIFFVADAREVSPDRWEDSNNDYRHNVSPLVLTECGSAVSEEKIRSTQKGTSVGH